MHIARADCLTGFVDAIEKIFPKTAVHSCIVHYLRIAMRFVAHKDRRAFDRDLKSSNLISRTPVGLVWLPKHTALPMFVPSLNKTHVKIENILTL